MQIYDTEFERNQSSSLGAITSEQTDRRT